MFQDVERLEIIQAYHYDQHNFFSLQRILFVPGMIDTLRVEEIKGFMKERHNPLYVDIIQQKGREILCILKQNRKDGFWPMFDTGPGRGVWAFIFPITVTPAFIHINLIAHKEYVGTLKGYLENYTPDYKILVQSDFEGDLSEAGISTSTMPIRFSPEFTPRQQEICQYAATHGYFETPKGVSAEKIAEHFDITVSAVNHNLRNAQRVAMKFFFGEKP